MPLAIITGTSGFVGSHLVSVLRETHEVLEVHRRPPVLGRLYARWDLADALPANLPSKADLIVHAAATDGRLAAHAAQSCFQVNTLATARLLDYAERAGVRQFVYFSTGSVYPLSPGPLSEADAIAPGDPYSASKAAAECLVAGYGTTFATLCLRLFYPYGPGQRIPRLIPGLIEKIKHGATIKLNGEQAAPRVNPVFISDVIAWTRKLIRQEATGVFNLAGTEIFSIRELAEQIAQQMNRKVDFRVGSPASGDMVGKIDRVTAQTGLTPQVSLTTGLARILQPKSDTTSQSNPNP